MKADINTIARECGVSKATVSRVFTGRASVSTPVKERILKIARELNYAPQQVAAREVIAIIVESLDRIGCYDVFRNILLTNLVGEIVRAGFLVNIIEARDIDKILDSYTKTAVILLNDVEALKYKEKLNNMKIPLIAVGNILDNCHSICSDYYGEIALAIDYLVKNGHSKISIVVDNADIRAGRERQRGYTETMKKHGLSPMASYDYHPEKQSLIELMAIMIQDAPTATIICGESISNEAVYALNLLGVKVPEDLSVISFEKQKSSRWFSPPHTTIDQNVLKIVTESMILIKKILAAHLKEKIHKRLSCSLVIRNSVKNMNIK
ncbi:MAG: LacI family DNA-binding transcriptional regulator [Victivallaceae bacterium]